MKKTLIIMNNIDNNMEGKRGIIKKNYTMIKSKSAVQFMRAGAFILWEKLLCKKL